MFCACARIMRARKRWQRYCKKCKYQHFTQFFYARDADSRAAAIGLKDYLSGISERIWAFTSSAFCGNVPSTAVNPSYDDFASLSEVLGNPIAS